MDSLELLQQADRHLVDLVFTLSVPNLDLPSPCSGWSVRSLLSHTIATIDAFAAALDGHGGPTEQEIFSGADIVGSAPLTVLEKSVDRSQQAWATIADWERPVATVIGEMPAGQAIGIITY